MTRNEFLESVNDWWELKDFCVDCDCDYLDSIYDEDGLNEEIDYFLREGYADDYSWRELRDALEDIPTGYDAYRQNNCFDWDGLDDGDFDSYKDDVLDWADDHGVWDEDEGDEEYFDEEPTEEEIIEEEPDERFEEADFSVTDLMGMCSVTLVTIQTDNLRRLQEENAAFNRLIDANIPKVIH